MSNYLDLPYGWDHPAGSPAHTRALLLYVKRRTPEQVVADLFKRVDAATSTTPAPEALMGKRKYFELSSKTKTLIHVKAADIANRLVDDTELTQDQAEELIATTIGDALELAAGLVGAPDTVAYLVGVFAGKVTEGIADALRPDLGELAAKATAALEAGDYKKAQRLMNRIGRVEARRARRSAGKAAG